MRCRRRCSPAGRRPVYLPARAGCHGRFGLPGVRFELPLQAMPAQMLLRWWGLIRACGGRPERVVRGFEFSPSFQRDLERLDELYFAPPPASLRELKQQLRQPLPQREEELFAAFAAVDPGFEPRCALLRQLRASGEPYTSEMLAIRPASLRALGLSGGSIAPVRELLLDAVIRAPELNRYETLARMAVELGPLARGGKAFEHEKQRNARLRACGCGGRFSRRPAPCWCSGSTFGSRTGFGRRSRSPFSPRWGSPRSIWNGCRAAAICLWTRC